MEIGYIPQFCVPYDINPHNSNLFNIINTTINSLSSDRTFGSILPKMKLINSKRQPPRLGNLLVKSKFSETNNKSYSVSKCKDKRCKTCEVILEGSEYILKQTGDKLKLKEDMDCRAKYVIYVIKCLGCGHDYIGSTKNLRHRVALHKNHIKDPRNEQCPVSSHLRTCSKGEFKIFPFLGIHSENSREMVNIEHGLINRYKPILNG